MSAKAIELRTNSWGDVPEWAYSAVRSAMASLKLKDLPTYYHCLRVGEYSRKLAVAAGLNEYQQKVAEFSGLLHDVGKVAISETIIHKPGRLNGEEYEKMKQHPCFSEEIIQPLTHHEFFRHILPAVRGHHERVDGTGYPDKLHGEDVPLVARIILIVDTLDAMGQSRAYRQGLPVEAIYAELKKYAGTQFDANLVKIFLEAHPNWTRESNKAETFQKKVA